MDYFTYVFEDTFGGFDKEDTLIINKFVSSKNQSEFIDSEVLEIMICYYIENNDIEKAGELLRKALNLYPNDEDIRFLEIALAIETDLQYALELAVKHASRYTDMQFLLIKSMLLFETHDFEQGEEVFYEFLEQVVGGEKAKTEMYYRFALSLCRMHYFDSNSDDEQDMQRYLLIKKMLKYAVSQEILENALFFAEQYHIYGFTTEAKLVLNHAIDSNSYNLEAWQMYSEMLADIGEYVDAADAFLYRISLGDSDKRLYFTCAVCFQKAKKYEKAIEHFENQIDKYTDELDDISFFCDILAEQGDCFMSLEMYDDAKAKFDEILKLNKNHFKALALSAKCAFKQENLNTALQYANLALNIAPDFDKFDYENLYVVIAQIFEEISENTENRREYWLNALISYRKSLIYLNLARKMDKYIEDLDDKISSALCSIGKMQLLLGDDIDALTNLQLAFYLNEETPMLNVLLVLTYFKLNLIKDGLVHYRLIANDDLERYEAMFPDLAFFRQFRDKN